MIKPLSVLFLLFLTSPANGMVYSWTDSAGIAHYTNKEYEIPQRYRATAKARYPEQGDSNIAPLTVHAPQAGHSIQSQPQGLKAAQTVPANANIDQTVKQLKRERAARKATRRNRDADDE